MVLLTVISSAWDYNSVILCQHLQDNSWLLRPQQGCKPPAEFPLQEHAAFLEGIPGCLMYLLPDPAMTVELITAPTWHFVLSLLPRYLLLWFTSRATTPGPLPQWSNHKEPSSSVSPVKLTSTWCKNAQCFRHLFPFNSSWLLAVKV